MSVTHVVITVHNGYVEYFIQRAGDSGPMELGADNREDFREFADDLRTCGHYEVLPSLDGGHLFFATSTREELAPQG